MPLRPTRRLIPLAALTAALAASACGKSGKGDAPAADDASELKIRGGETTDVDTMRQAVRLTDGAKTFCSGVLVRSNIVLTAAHCWNGTSPDHAYVEVPRAATGGAVRFDRYEIESAVTQTYALHNHVLKQSGGLKVDLSAVVLKTTVKRDPTDPDSPNLPPLAVMSTNEARAWLPTKKMNRETFLEDESASPFMIYGYGYTREENPQSSGEVGTLREARVPFRGYWGLNDEELHVGLKKSLACWADSGGPLVARRTDRKWLVGISSRFFTYDEGIYSCGNSDGSIYTDVTAPHVATWLDAVAQANPPSL